MNKYISKYLIYYPITIIMGENIPKYFHQYEKSQWLKREELVELQREKLESLIRHAKKSVPFYRNRYYGLDLDPNGKSLHKCLGHLPLLKKADLRESKKLFCSEKRHLLNTQKTTGGSTGQAVTILKNSRAMACERAGTWRAYGWTGIGIGDKHGRFWGVPSDSRNRLKLMASDFITNRRRFTAFGFNESTLQEYYEALRRYKPLYLYGYVSMLSEFAKYVKKMNYDRPCKLKAVITTAEVLGSNRKLLEQVFGCRVFNEYGCGEVGSIAHECIEGNMHIMAENMIVEILNHGHHCKDGEIGEVVVTELNNYAMPLIRYCLGDYAVYSDMQCGCGRGLPVIKNVVGREYDMVRINGRMYHGEFFMYIFEDLIKEGRAVMQFQVVQVSEEALLIRVIPDEKYGCETEAFIRQRIRERMGASVQVQFEEVDAIPREKSGKMRIIKALENCR